MLSITKPAAPHGPALVLLAAFVGVIGCLVGAAAAQEPGAKQGSSTRDGMFITVPNPIESSSLNEIEKKIDDAIVAQRRSITTIVFDFNPKGLASATSKFGSPRDLAKFIRGLKLQQNPRYPSITTVALVSNEVSKHTMLPVLACEQIVMSEEVDPATLLYKARIGDISRDTTEHFDETMRTAYRDIAMSGKKFSPDLVARMIDRDLPLKCVSYQKDGNKVTHYKSPESLRKLEQEGVKWQEEELPAGLQTGNGMFDVAVARKVGLCDLTANSREELRDKLALPWRSLNEDWQIGRTKMPWRIELRGALDRGKLDSFERRIRAAVGKGANILILQLESERGDTTHVEGTAEFLRQLRDANDVPVRTVAYIPAGHALGAATFLALGCREIVMGPKAALADFSYLDDDKLRSVAQMLKRFTRDQPLLFEACVDRNLVLYRVRARGAVAPQLITEEEFRKDQESKAPVWAPLGRLDRPAGSLQKITTELAREFHIAVPVEPPPQDFGGVYAYYDLDARKVHVSRDDWLDEVAEFFRSPVVNFLLIMFGIIGLILEMKMPGTTVPGVIAALCFVLFFWAYSFVGEFTFLAVLLFVLGLVLIGLEIFVIPGFGFTGISGLVLVIASLVLVTLDRMPQSPQDWVGVGTTIGTFGLSLVFALAIAFLIAWFLPSIPYANRLVLKPPDEEQSGYETGAAQLNAALLGAIGVAATPLRPAGKAQFGDDFLDVIAEGDYVMPGRRVQVIELEGNRIVVKEI